MRGVGIDILEISRIEKWKDNESMLNYVFTSSEVKAIQAQREPDKFVAVLYAAKEAFMKAVGTGWSKEVGWKDIEVSRDEEGTFSIRPSSRVNEMLRGRNISLTVACTESLAIATVLIE